MEKHENEQKYMDKMVWVDVNAWVLCDAEVHRGTLWNTLGYSTKH